MSDEALASIIFVAMGFVPFLPAMLYIGYKKLKGENYVVKSDSSEA